MSEWINFGILTVSDRCFAGECEDKSGPALCNLVESLIPSSKIVKTDCVPDEIEDIVRVLEEWTAAAAAPGADANSVDVVLTTGGTGFAPRDVTPEATLRVIDRRAPMFAAAVALHCLPLSPLAALSRAEYGLCGRVLIVNLPGSPKAACECFEAIAMMASHAVAIARGRGQHPTLDHGHKVEQKHCRPQSHSGCGGHRGSARPQGAVLDASLGASLAAPVARRLRSSPFPMISVQEAQRMVRQQALQGALLGVETVAVGPLLVGRVVAESVCASEAHPPFAASLKDGYALRAKDGRGPRRVVAVAAAGHESVVEVGAGQCVRINTGAPLPPGTDAVVQVEDTRLLEEADGGLEEVVVEVLVEPTPGMDVRAMGSDVSPGQQVVGAGTVVGAAEVGVLSGSGVARVRVHRLPSVALLSTGDELQDALTALAQGLVRDSNRPTLSALLTHSGFTVLDMGIAKDSRESMVKAFERGLSSADVLVTTGSVSMGDRDFVKQVLLNDLGATIHFGRINMKPGKPTTFATVPFEGRKRFVLALPGNPVSAAVTAHLFLLPLLRMLSGHPRPMPTTVRATMEGHFPLDPRPEYHRVSLSWSRSNDLPVARSTGVQASSRLLSVVGANALALLPAASDSCSVLPSGSVVDALLLSDFY